MEKYFKKLLTNIKLTDPQKKDAKTKRKNVCKALHSKYCPDSTYDRRTEILIGAYGKYTHIRPPRDIDILFKMPESEFERFNNLNGNKQSQLLQEVRSVLSKTFTTTEKINAFGKVVVINFNESLHSVELLPAWQKETGEFLIPNTENGGSWDTWNPKAEIQNINDCKNINKKTKSLIRILKAWSSYCLVPDLKSFLIEILVVNFLTEKMYDYDENTEYSKLVVGFFEWLQTKENTHIYLHSNNSSLDIGNDWFSKVSSALTRSTKALTYEEEGNFVDSAKEWKKVFGNNFPLAENKSIDSIYSQRIVTLNSLYPSSSEQYIDTHFGYPLEINPLYEIQIDTDAEVKGFRKNSLNYFNSLPGVRLLKLKWLDFEVKKCNIPGEYTIFWKVRNFGEEADSKGQLRGEITKDEGGRKKRERTLYLGDHYVECYAIQNNKCVAIANLPVLIGDDHE